LISNDVSILSAAAHTTQES